MDRVPHYPCTLVVPVRDEQDRVVAQLIRDSHAARLPIVVVDDGSKIPCPYARIRLPQPRGYGAALKVGVRTAQTPWVAMMDGDGQHEVEDVVRLLEFLPRFPEADMVIGNRRVHETDTKRWWGRKGLNILASVFAWRWIPDLNSGMRLVRRDVVLGYEPILCDRFSYTTSLTLSALVDGYDVTWLPIRVFPRMHGQTKVRIWHDGWVTLRYIVWIGLALRTRGIRVYWRRLPLRARAVLLVLLGIIAIPIPGLPGWWFWTQTRGKWGHERRQTAGT